MATPLSGLQEYLRGVAVEDASALRREEMGLRERMGERAANRADRQLAQLSRYQDESLQERRERTRALADLQREQIAARREALANRPRPQGAIIQTAEGVFERTPGGLQQLKDPTTGRPLKPKVGEKPVTEFQGKNALYGSRAMMSDAALKALEDTLSDEALAAVNSKVSVQGAPLIGGAAGAALNFGLSADQQRFEQAQRNFVNAVLRQESGAVISDQEFENARKQYFRQPGDKPDVVAQKRANRRAAIEGFKKIAGPAWAGDEAIGAMGATGGGWDDAKEKRYQELLKKRGGS